MTSGLGATESPGGAEPENRRSGHPIDDDNDADTPAPFTVGHGKEETMRNILKVLLISAALAMVAGAGIATTAAPANAQVILDFGVRPYYYAPYGYYYAPTCYWDAFYGRVCY